MPCHDMPLPSRGFFYSRPDVLISSSFLLLPVEALLALLLISLPITSLQGTTRVGVCWNFNGMPHKLLTARERRWLEGIPLLCRLLTLGLTLSLGIHLIALGVLTEYFYYPHSLISSCLSPLHFPSHPIASSSGWLHWEEINFHVMPLGGLFKHHQPNDDNESTPVPSSTHTYPPSRAHLIPLCATCCSKDMRTDHRSSNSRRQTTTCLVTTSTCLGITTTMKTKKQSNSTHRSEQKVNIAGIGVDDDLEDLLLPNLLQHLSICRRSRLSNVHLEVATRRPHELLLPEQTCEERNWPIKSSGTHSSSPCVAHQSPPRK